MFDSVVTKSCWLTFGQLSSLVVHEKIMTNVTALSIEATYAMQLMLSASVSLHQVPVTSLQCSAIKNASDIRLHQSVCERK